MTVGTQVFYLHKVTSVLNKLYEIFSDIYGDNIIEKRSQQILLKL